MFEMKKTIAIALSAAAVCCCLAACGQEDPQPSQTADTTPTVQPTETTSPVETTQATEPTQGTTRVPVEYQGLHFYLDDTYTTGEAEGKFTFQNVNIQGGVEFGTPSKLTGGYAQTSADYAKYLQKELQDDHEKIWVGSSTGIGYYLVLQDPDLTRVQCLYVKDDKAWNIWAESADDALTDELIRICGKCAIITDQSPKN
ncbi:MAG: hypothetical protein IIV61_01680 [Oscillospiraceae bacterium]|nr:hypothetical protein [Oscillospiraceae bacterium]MBQ5711300.1 hypothetical protein [Oscillospiraceae bacterium]